MRSTSNFEFLADHDPKLVQLGAFAERYFRDDPPTCLIKVRQLAELVAKLIAAHHALYTKDRETFEERLRRLHYDRIIPREVNDIFHKLRILGNAAAHEAVGNHAEALTGLKLARELAIWFHRTYGKKPQFKAGAFSPPREPVDDTAKLREEIEGLQRRIVEIQTAAASASRAVLDKASALESAEERLRREAEERAVWEQLAQELELEKNQLTARLARQEEQILFSARPMLEGLREDSARFSDSRRDSSIQLSSLVDRLEKTGEIEIETTLATLQAIAETSPKADTQGLIERGEKAAAQIDLDEASTRALIDQQLRDSGWGADTKTLRFASGSRPVKGSNLAIAEWPTANGPADYALFAGLTLVGVVEAKCKRKNVSAAIDQAERYSKGLSQQDGFTFAGGPWADHKVPFVFAANGRSYLKQIETESGIWFRDTRRPVNHRRALVDWPTPEGLSGLIEINQDAAAEALEALPFEFGFPLRDYQQHAIEAVEKALKAERRSMLLAMATGTGKTKLAIAMLYRLLATKMFRRICFVVDRSALGIQAAGEFSTTKIVSGKAFADIFGLKTLEDVTPESETKVHICTIQGLVKRVLFTADDSEAPPIDQYDLIVVDECHRGYLLDREMSDAELSFRGQDDYVSKYRRVLGYFDAVKIGLTATPALHTTEIFGDPIFTYSYRDAVVEGHLIDHEPPLRIETALARAGSHHFADILAFSGARLAQARILSLFR
jgi:type I restriction enzyme, R subunit